MVPRAAGRTLSLFGMALALWVVCVGTARAQDKGPQARVEQLNKRAMESYDLLDFKEAKKLLLQSVGLLKKNGLEADPAAAHTYVDLGMLYVAGIKDAHKGFQYFLKALQVDPQTRLDPALATPEIQQVFEDAQAAAGLGKGNKGGGTSGPPTPPTPPGPGPGPGPNAEGAKGLIHKVIDEAALGVSIPVRAQLGADVAPGARVFLFYRSGGKEDYVAIQMGAKGRAGAFEGLIPGGAAVGRSLQYYIEVRDAHGRPLYANGSPASPNIISLSAGGPVAGGQGGAVEQRDEGETPPMGAPDREHEGDRDHADGAGTHEEEGQVKHTAPAHEGIFGIRFWFAFGIGSGLGLVTAPTEFTGGNVEGLVAPAKLLHITPEFGVFVKDRMAVSLQGRIQMFPGADPMTGAVPPSITQAWLVRLRYYSSDNPFRGYATLALGGGHLRHTVPLKTSDVTDTVDSGPFFVGPGAGLEYDLSPHLSFMFETQVLVGFDHLTANLDFNLGVAVHL